MDALLSRDLWVFLAGAGVSGACGALAYALRLIRRLEARLSEVEARRVEAPAPVDILAQAQAEARNRQLAILAAVDLADYVSQNFPGSSVEIIKRIAPHLIDRKVG